MLNLKTTKTSPEKCGKNGKTIFLKASKIIHYLKGNSLFS